MTRIPNEKDVSVTGVSAALLILLLAFGCQVQPNQSDNNQAKQATRSKQLQEQASAKLSSAKNTNRPAFTGTATSVKDAKWKSNLKWHSWADGRKESAKTGKPLCLVVFTDWCPKCRKLGPLFQDKVVERLANDVVMVRQDQDERPDWLNEYVQYGRYVPRIFFFSSAGVLLSDITSPIDRYPYFYTPNSVSAFRTSLQKALSQK